VDLRFSFKVDDVWGGDSCKAPGGAKEVRRVTTARSSTPPPTCKPAADYLPLSPSQMNGPEPEPINESMNRKNSQSFPRCLFVVSHNLRSEEQPSWDPANWLRWISIDIGITDVNTCSFQDRYSTLCLSFGRY